MRTTSKQDRPKNMIALLIDAPNIITILGLFLSLAAVALAIQQEYNFAIIAVLWAVIADWIDGWLASRLSQRPAAHGEIGAQLDSFADFTSSGLFPAVLIMTMGDFSFLAVAVALFLAAAGVLRLSFFNVFGTTEDGKITGLPIAHNIIVLTGLFLLRPMIESSMFFHILAATGVVLAVANVGPFFFPRGRPIVIPWLLAFALASSIWLSASSA